MTSKLQAINTSDLIALSSAALTLIAIYFAIRAIHVAQDQMSFSMFIEIKNDIRDNYCNFLYDEKRGEIHFKYELLNSFENGCMFYEEISNKKIRKELSMYIADCFATFENRLEQTGGMDAYKSQEDNFEHLKKFIAQNKHRIEDTKRKLQPNPTKVVDAGDEIVHIALDDGALDITDTNAVAVKS